MTTLLTPVRSARDTRVTLVGVAGFAIALAAASQVAIPVPFTPVPITLQPLVVVLAGLMLGPRAGAASMLLYLVAGALARREPSLIGRWLAATAGVVVILVGGVAQLAIVSQSLSRAVAIGLTPFALLDVVKAFVAALVAGRRPASVR